MKVYFVGHFKKDNTCSMLSQFFGDDNLSESTQLFLHKAGAFELLKSVKAECKDQKLDVIEFDLNFHNPRIV